MRYVTVECPRCDANHEYLLSREEDHHLRQCPECAGWFVFHQPRDRTEFLDDPPTCPVDGCEETVEPDRLPVHVIEVHDGSLAAQ